MNHEDPNSKPDLSSGAKGFTLVEWVIIFSIIGVLTAVGTPVLNNNVKRAMQAEASASLTNIKLQLDIYLAGDDVHPEGKKSDYIIGAAWNDLEAGELTGKYFTDSSYTYFGNPNNSHFKIYCAKGSMMDQDRTMDQDGVLRNE